MIEKRAPARVLRTTVSSIGVAIAIIIFVAAPAGYFVVRYASDVNELDFKSRLTAGNLAKYIYRYRELWQYQAPRLAELMDFGPQDYINFTQEVYDRTGKFVVRSGSQLMGPLLVRSADIVVTGIPVGRVDAMIGLRPLLESTGLVALFSGLLGFVAYFAIGLFPLRALDRTIEELHHTERNLAEQNKRFGAAITNMVQGLCMFDAEAKLVLFNPRFAQIYGVSPDRIALGMTTRDLMELIFASSKALDVDTKVTFALQGDFIRERKGGLAVEHLTDGRTVSIVHQPMPDGGFVVTFEDITELILAEEKVRHLANYDVLTGLPNRVTFYELTASILRRLRRGESVAVLSLDLDHFKSVNDTLGHPVGDKLLQVAAERMRSCVRAEDIVARRGGDEFAIVQVPSVPPPSPLALATRLVEVVGAPYEFDGHQVIVGASIGIAIAPGDGDKLDSLVKNADLALDRAKADGGNIYRFFKTEMDALMQARRAIELDLRKAIVNGEFELHFQPIVNVKTGKITSCEALIRWHHPERGMVSPFDFIPIAEETSLIVPIGEWVLHAACSEAVRWPEDVSVAVNLSAVQFESCDLVNAVAHALAVSGLAANRLVLEITESVLLQDNKGALDILHQFRDLGIRIAMDDFGTGYSSLGYLRSFPFDTIKIDQSFIRDLTTKEDSIAIVRAVVGLGKSLGIMTTAEGVETREQLLRVTAEGCDEVQGFYFNPPKTATEVEQILRDWVPAGEAAA